MDDGQPYLPFLLEGDTLPEPKTMLEATIKVAYSLSLSAAKDLYLRSMQRAVLSENKRYHV